MDGWMDGWALLWPLPLASAGSQVTAAPRTEPNFLDKDQIKIYLKGKQQFFFFFFVDFFFL